MTSATPWVATSSGRSQLQSTSLMPVLYHNRAAGGDPGLSDISPRWRTAKLRPPTPGRTSPRIPLIPMGVIHPNEARSTPGEARI